MTLDTHDGALVIEVSDDGIGLPPERERILEPYMTTRAKGTGLGLAIVKKIVEEHMGEISFRDAQGGGACISIRLDPETLEKLEEGRDAATVKGSVTAHGA